MVSARPWKADAVLRLVVSVLICFFAGSLAAGILHHTGNHPPVRLYLVAAGAFACFALALAMVRTRWTLENLRRRMAVLLVFFYAGILLAAWAQQMAGPPKSEVPSTLQTVIAVTAVQGLALLWTTLLLREHQMGWAEAFGLDNQWQRALLLGIVGACIFLPIGWSLQRVSAAGIDVAAQKLKPYLPRLNLKPEVQLPVQTIAHAVSPLERIILAFITILLAPVGEELLFRGILFSWLKQIGYPTLAWLGTALLFAAIHANLVSFAPLFVLALILAALYHYTENLLAPITAHALFNAINFVMVYSAEQQSFGPHGCF